MTRVAVTDWLLRGGRPAATPDLFATDDASLALRGVRGHFALHQEQGGVHRLARDALGVNKLFFAIDDATGGVASSTFLADLIGAGYLFTHVSSVPWGHVVTVDPRSRRLELQKALPLPFGDEDGPATEAVLEEHARRVGAALDETFGALAKALEGRTVYVTLSGGLDSTVVATVARRFIAGLTAVTFSMGEEGKDAGSEDLGFARRVASKLGLPLVEVWRPPGEILALLDDTLRYGQDYRDFNVHCGLVNAALAEAIGARHPGAERRPVVLTGDPMNELVADYTPIEYGAREYYPLPRMRKAAMRRFLVQGLDAGDREVGIFAHFGVDCIQPYAICADVYTSLPGPAVEVDQAKQRLVELVMGHEVPSFVLDRPKVRAQAGGTQVGGTLAVLAEAGIDQAALRHRFGEVMGLLPGQTAELIRMGLYRFLRRWPATPVASS